MRLKRKLYSDKKEKKEKEEEPNLIELAKKKNLTDEEKKKLYKYGKKVGSASMIASILPGAYIISDTILRKKKDENGMKSYGVSKKKRNIAFIGGTGAFLLGGAGVYGYSRKKLKELEEKENDNKKKE